MQSKAKWLIICGILILPVFMLTNVVPLETPPGASGNSTPPERPPFLYDVFQMILAVSFVLTIVYCFVRFVKWAWHHD